MASSTPEKEVKVTEENLPSEIAEQDGEISDDSNQHILDRDSNLEFESAHDGPNEKENAGRKVEGKQLSLENVSKLLISDNDKTCNMNDSQEGVLLKCDSGYDSHAGGETDGKDVKSDLSVDLYENVSIRTIEIPEDDDLFDFQKDKNLENESNNKLENTELYRYLTVNNPNLLREGEITPSQSRHDSGESDQSDATDGYVTLSSDEEETPDKNSRRDSYNSSNIEEEVTPQKQIPVAPVARKKPGRKPNPNKVCKKPSKSEGLSARTLDKLEKSKIVTDKWIKDLAIPDNLSFSQSVKLDLLELNQYLTCGLCKGYLYEASTVTECMHTFCKNCIVRHCMEVSLHCPVCHILIHPTDPFVNIRLDRMIQDIVYKLLPNVAETEMERIEQFYSEHPEVEPKEIYQPPCQNQISPKDKEDQTKSPCVSLLLETEDGVVKQESLEKKFIRVTSMATIDNVCSFLKRKLNLTDQSEIDLYCCGDAVEDRESTLENIKNKFFGHQDSLMLLQYKVRES